VRRLAAAFSADTPATDAHAEGARPIFVHRTLASILAAPRLSNAGQVCLLPFAVRQISSAPRHLESAKNFWSAAARRRFSAASTLKLARSTPKQRHRERANA